MKRTFRITAVLLGILFLAGFLLNFVAEWRHGEFGFNKLQAAWFVWGVIFLALGIRGSLTRS